MKLSMPDPVKWQAISKLYDRCYEFTLSMSRSKAADARIKMIDLTDKLNRLLNLKKEADGVREKHRLTLNELQLSQSNSY